MTTALQSGKPFNWPSMTGLMDQRSSPDKVPWGRWRMVLNVRAVEKGRACRREGWRRFDHHTGHPNCDLNNQRGTSQPLRSLFLYQSLGKSAAGNRLYIGGRTEIWCARQDGGKDNVAHALPEGGDWCFTGLNELVIACNGRVVRYQHPDLGQFQEIPSLALIGLTSAAVCWTFEGTLFLADLVQDGYRVGHRIVWPHVGTIDFDMGLDSIAGFKDLSPSETVLAAVPMGTTYTVFTTHGAYRHGVVDGQFVFQQLYYSKNQDACAVSGRAIATNREIAYFMGSDGIYALAPYSPSPEWSEWINQGLPAEFISADRCLISSSAYDPSRGELLFSSAELGKTYVVNLRQQSTSIIDHGFHAMVYAELDPGESTTQWLVRSGICTSAHVDSIYPVGALDDPRVHPAVTGVADTCTPFDAPCDSCEVRKQFLAVSAVDNAIKAFDPLFFGREMRVGNGWQTLGYATKFITGAMDFGTEEDKRVHKLVVNFIAPASDVVPTARAAVGQSGSPIDPQVSMPRSARRLHLRAKNLLSPNTPGGSAPNIQPLEWTFIFDGRFIWFELEVESTTGNAVCFSAMMAKVTKSTNTTV